MKPSNYWCFNWFMTPKSLIIRLNDLLSGDCVSVCWLEFTFLEQSVQWFVPIVRIIMNKNKLHVLLLNGFFICKQHIHAIAIKQIYTHVTQ